MKKPLNIKKLVLLNLPYILMGLFSTCLLYTSDAADEL